jgi:hypothetical protein
MTTHRSSGPERLRELADELIPLDARRDKLLVERVGLWKLLRPTMSDTEIARLSVVSPARIAQRLGPRGTIGSAVSEGRA